MAASHMNGAAENGNAARAKNPPSQSARITRSDCEQPLREIDALVTAISALGLATDAKETGYRTGEAIYTLAQMIRERLSSIDAVLFGGSALGDIPDGGANV